MEEMNLIPVAISTAIGLLAGAALVIAVAVKRGGDPSAGERALLIGKKSALYEQIRDLDADAGKLGEGAWQEARERLIEDAAEVLRQLDAIPSGARAKPSNPLVPPLAFSAVVALFSLWAVLDWPAETDGALPPSPPTMAQSPHGGKTDGMPLPDDLLTLNAMTWQAISEGNLAAAMRANERAREVGPDDPVALSHRQALRITVGMHDQAKTELDALLTRFPDHPHVLFWAGLVRAEQGDKEGSELLFRRIAQVAPDAQEWKIAEGILQDMAATPAPPAP